MTDTFETIKNDNRLLYSYVRGSHCHGISTPTSDVDKGGIFISRRESLIDLGFNYQDEVKNETNDIVWWEVKKFMNLLIKSNPTVLEALFVDNKFVEIEHPLITRIKEYKDLFLTKKCLPAFFNYGKSQVEKAKGLNKKINWDIPQRKTPFDFAYTFYNQGSTKISNWLENRGLNKDFCGLVRIPNMHDTYGVYYDWGAHFETNGIKSFKDVINKDTKLASFISSFYELGVVPGCEEMMEERWFEGHKEVLHYRGMCLENATDMRGSSVSKGEKPLCHMVYNESGFKDHCKKYKEYKDWVKHRNPIRYQSNLQKSYDAKNMCECFRLMNCGIEIAEGKGYIVDRSKIDGDFLLDIKNHKFEYEFLISELEKLKEKMNEVAKVSKLPEDIDPNFVNKLYLDIIKEFF